MIIDYIMTVTVQRRIYSNCSCECGNNKIVLAVNTYIYNIYTLTLIFYEGALDITTRIFNSDDKSLYNPSEKTENLTTNFER
jgi:hypothetical protein